MLTVYQFPRPTWEIPSISPACIELETWLRMTGIPHTLGPWVGEVDPPKGKWPFIKDGEQVVADASLCIEYLKATRGIDPDHKLATEQRAVGLAFRRLLKENLYWVGIYDRWIDESGWAQYRPLVVPLMLDPASGESLEGEALEARLAEMRKDQKDQWWGHGMGRHSAEEIYRIGAADVKATSDYLGDKPFFFGDEPTTTDATIYGYIASTIDVPIDSHATRSGRQHKNLVAYCRRMRERFYPELRRTEAYDLLCA